MKGFFALLHDLPHKENCVVLNETELTLTKDKYCNWIITAPSMTSTITFKFQNDEVKFHHNQNILIHIGWISFPWYDQ